MKVYIQIEGWEGYPDKKSSVKIPKSWDSNGKTCADVMGLFIEAYNGKNPDTIIELEAVHLESQLTDGTKFYSDAKCIDVLDDYGDYFITRGAYVSSSSAGAGATASSTTKTLEVDSDGIPLVKCKNYGCGQMFSESSNTETSCRYHSLPPFFHDTAKGWQCCNERKAYDWDDFNAIEGCLVGLHSTVDPKVKFMASPTVEAAAAANESSTTPSTDTAPKTVLASIEQFNKSNPNATTGATSMAKTLQSNVRKSTQNADGITAKCQRKGCQLTFNIADNHTGACTYHAGNAVFHDTWKYWSCCPGKKCYEFDEFMKVPGCETGCHDDGVIDLSTPGYGAHTFSNGAHDEVDA